MSGVTIHAAKTNLSRRLARVEAGEEIIFARGKTPIATIVPVHTATRRRHFGALRGLIDIGPEFFEPLPESERAAWE